MTETQMKLVRCRTLLLKTLANNMFKNRNRESYPTPINGGEWRSQVDLLVCHNKDTTIILVMLAQIRHLRVRAMNSSFR